MIYHTSKYELHKDDEVISFDSEKDACEYLNVKQCSVASCYRRNTLCKGYKIVKLGSSTHNDTKSRLFKIWSGMKERCYRTKHKHYKKLTISQVSEKYNIPKSTVRWRNNNNRSIITGARMDGDPE